MYLHCVVLIINVLFECLEYRVNYDVRYFV
jgi:hypothetical protein